MRRSESLAAFAILACTCLAPVGADADENVLEQWSGRSVVSLRAPVMDDAGTVVLSNYNEDFTGENSRHAWQIVSWDATTGAATPLTDARDGVSRRDGSVSVSDDGQWIAFASPADLVGQNHDESVELFVMHPDGTGIAQLTHHPGPTRGEVRVVAIAGSGNRIVFTADLDPLGTNPDRLAQLFVVDRDGSNLRQLTFATIDFPASVPTVSDDGERIVFNHKGNLVGTNPDGSSEVFAVQADGTGLRQLTASNGWSSEAMISGNGAKIVFTSTAGLVTPNPLGHARLYTMNWDGTGLKKVLPFTALDTWYALHGAITDDGLTVFYESDQPDPVLNPSGNREIWKIGVDGTGKANLTGPDGGDSPVVSGQGTRVVFFRFGFEMRSMPASGGPSVVLATSDSYPDRTIHLDVTPDGSRVAFARGIDVYRSDSTEGEVRLTTLSGFDTYFPQIGADPEVVLFRSASNPTGGNLDHDPEIFRVSADGTGLQQLTPNVGTDGADEPSLASNGSWVVFASSENYDGTNPGHEYALHRMRTDGTEIARVTTGSVGYLCWPRVDPTGAWVVYQNITNADGQNADRSSEVFRVRVDGSGQERITGDDLYRASRPDLSSGGARIVYQSDADPLGTNADHNPEIFLFEPASGNTRQLTETLSALNLQPRITEDGAWVYFESSAPFFEPNPGGLTLPYRLRVSDGSIERAGGLARGAADTGVLTDWTWIATGADGDVAAYIDYGDFTGRNADYDDEVFVIRKRPGRIEVGKDSPTVVAWETEAAPVRYDVIRGDVANLNAGGGTVDLGPVSCVEDDSPDTDTIGNEDPEEPDPGQCYFFLYRGSQGVAAPSGSYGAGSGGAMRVPGSGACADP